MRKGYLTRRGPHEYELCIMLQVHLCLLDPNQLLTLLVDCVHLLPLQVLVPWFDTLGRDDKRILSVVWDGRGEGRESVYDFEGGENTTVSG